ncbi:MAG TPA: hypothetical protein VKQ29_12170 [Aliidongia sp.]|nr:hypothetical protein [Aliidongia sp.]
MPDPKTAISTKLEAATSAITEINHRGLVDLRTALWDLNQSDAALAIDDARNHLAEALHALHRAATHHQEAGSGGASTK